MPFRTLNDVLLKYKNVGPGFDLMRFVLAFVILYGHCWYIAAGAGGTYYLSRNLGSNAAVAPVIPSLPSADSASRLWEILHTIRLTLVLNHSDSHFYDVLVPMFFALSGFLVTGSAFRTKSIRPFLTFRILRIVPALLTEVSLSALLLGPLLTVFPLSKYFADEKFFVYFGNIFGFVQFKLPGLFLHNPVPEIVNLNLWTLPPEFYCYLIIAGLIVSRVLFDRFVFSALFVISSISLIAANLLLFYDENIHNNLIIVYYFFVGSMMYHWREYIPYSPWLLGVSLAATYFHFLSADGYMLIFPFFVTYVIIFLGLTKLPRLRLIQSGDYSYGIYLYGFPIAQALVTTVPKLQGHGIWLASTAIPLTIAFAAVSWHGIEKRMLALKKHFDLKSDAGVGSKTP